MKEDDIAALHEALTAAGYGCSVDEGYKRQHLGLWVKTSVRKRLDGYWDLTFKGPEGEVIISIWPTTAVELALQLFKIEQKGEVMADERYVVVETQRGEGLVGEVPGGATIPNCISTPPMPLEEAQEMVEALNSEKS